MLDATKTKRIYMMMWENTLRFQKSEEKNKHLPNNEQSLIIYPSILNSKYMKSADYIYKIYRIQG